MKRFISLILILVTLTSTGTVLAEYTHCKIEVQIHAGDQDIPICMDAYADNERLYFTSSLCPDICLLIPGVNSEEISGAITEFARNIRNEKTSAVIMQSVTEWIAFMRPETRNGSFTGDAFDYATSMERITFSYGDLTLLGQKIVSALREQDLGGVLIESDWSSLLMPDKNYRFDLKAFDGGKYASLNVTDGEDTLMTVSANMSDPDNVLVVIGRGFGGKNYYSRILAEKKESRMEISEMMYADDLKTGFAGLGNDALICTRTVTFSATEKQGKLSSFQISSSLLPANDLTAIRFAGTFLNEETGRVFDGEIWFPRDDRFSINIIADMDHEMPAEMPARMIDMEQADDRELIGVGTEIGIALLPIMYQVITALPTEYAEIIMQMMGF